MASTTITTQTILNAVKSDSTDSIRSEYVSADVSEKAKIRKIVQDAMLEAVRALDAELAVKVDSFASSLKSVSTGKVEIDHKARYAEFVATVGAFWADVMSGRHVPEGIELDETDKSDVLDEITNLAWDEMDEKANSDMLDKLRKVRNSRASGRDIPKHIEQVFSDLPVGTFLSNSKVAKSASDEYGTDRPSSGAVAACKRLPEGIVRVARVEGKSPEGLRKIA